MEIRDRVFRNERKQGKTPTLRCVVLLAPLVTVLISPCALPMEPTTDDRTIQLSLATADCAVGCGAALSSSTEDPDPPGPTEPPVNNPPVPEPPSEPKPPAPEPEPEPKSPEPPAAPPAAPPITPPADCPTPAQGIINGPKQCNDFGDFVSSANDEAIFVIARCIEENDDGSLPWFVLLPIDTKGNFPWYFAEENCDNTAAGTRNKVWRVDGCRCEG